MADIFISYAREDSERTAHVARSLEALGYDVFWDFEIPPGENWSDYTQNKLAQSKIMIVLWSEQSTGSQWVREEARLGRDANKLIPVMLDHVSAPFGFGEVQSADLTSWTGHGDDAVWRRFVAALAARIGAPTGTPAPAPASPPRQQFVAQSSDASASATGAALSPIDYIKKCFRMYVNANGRAARPEYWWWFLFAFVASFAAGLLDVLLFGINRYTDTANTQLFGALVALAILAPGICVAIRRFHDVGLSGWFVAGAFAAVIVGGAVTEMSETLGGFIILLAAIAVLVVALLPSKPGANVYGPNPKGA
jgi:uncharacterized membrane protein YhaH (DUF805 family)